MNPAEGQESIGKGTFHHAWRKGGGGEENRGTKVKVRQADKKKVGSLPRDKRCARGIGGTFLCQKKEEGGRKSLERMKSPTNPTKVFFGRKDKFLKHERRGNRPA